MNEPLGWKPSGGDSELIRPLTHRHQEALEARYPSCGENQARSLEAQALAGPLVSSLWVRGAERALTWFVARDGELRIYGLWLDPLRVETVPSLLHDVALERGARLTLVTDMIPQLTDETQESLFPTQGFWHRRKVLMRYDNPGSGLPRPPAGPVRPIRPGDLPEIVGIYVRAYRIRPREFWTDVEPVEWEAAKADVMRHWEKDRWSPEFLPEGSFVWEEGGRVLGAVLAAASRHGVPYLEDLVVEPRYHRRGIGRAIMEASVEAISAAGHPAVELAAIRSGAPYRLYLRLGFREISPPRGRLDGQWVLGANPIAGWELG